MMAEPAETQALFDIEDETAKHRAVEAARAQLADGKSVPWADVRRWLGSWGKKDELPPPSCG
jgi:predicted transcriptional regulator